MNDISHLRSEATTSKRGYLSTNSSHSQADQSCSTQNDTCSEIYHCNSYHPPPLLSISLLEEHHRPMLHILKRFSRHIPSISQSIRVESKSHPKVLSCKQSENAKHNDQHTPPIHMPQPPSYSVSNDQLTSPAISIILILPEINGATSSRSMFSDVHCLFLKIPWKLHHKIQIQDKISLDVIGNQEFYFMSRKLPLWSHITTSSSRGRVRIQLFVRNYNAMVEFYRLVTNSEMESQKPGFCVFILNNETYNQQCDITSCSCSHHHHHHHHHHRSHDHRQQHPHHRHYHSHHCHHHPTPTSPVELALKISPHINPFPLSDVSLNFPVRNFESLRMLLSPTTLHRMSPWQHQVNDPDGNIVTLHEVDTNATSDFNVTIAPLPDQSHQRIDQTFTNASTHSNSIDSGHVSDFDFI